MRILLPLAPACISFGPLFLALGAQTNGFGWVAYVGALMTSMGMSTLLSELATQHRDLKKVIADRDERVELESASAGSQ